MCAAVHVWRTNGEQSLWQKPDEPHGPTDARIKTSSYETFKAFNQTCTVAVFAPAKMALPCEDVEVCPLLPTLLSAYDLRLGRQHWHPWLLRHLLIEQLAY